MSCKNEHPGTSPPVKRRTLLDGGRVQVVLHELGATSVGCVVLQAPFATGSGEGSGSGPGWASAGAGTRSTRWCPCKSGWAEEEFTAVSRIIARRAKERPPRSWRACCNGLVQRTPRLAGRLRSPTTRCTCRARFTTAIPPSRRPRPSQRRRSRGRGPGLPGTNPPEPLGPAIHSSARQPDRFRPVRARGQARRNRAASPSATARPRRVGRSAPASQRTSPSSDRVAISR